MAIVLSVPVTMGLGASRAIAYDRDDFGTLRDQDLMFDLIGGATHGIFRPRVAAVFALANAARAHATLEAGWVTRGRLVLEIEHAVPA